MAAAVFELGKTFDHSASVLAGMRRGQLFKPAGVSRWNLSLSLQVWWRWLKLATKPSSLLFILAARFKTRSYHSGILAPLFSIMVLLAL